MARKEASHINDLVAMLDHNERLLICFYYVERLSPAEIAQILDLAPQNVLTKLCEVRSRIRKALRGSQVEPEAEAERCDSSLRAASSPV